MFQISLRSDSCSSCQQILNFFQFEHGLILTHPLFFFFSITFIIHNVLKTGNNFFRVLSSSAVFLKKFSPFISNSAFLSAPAWFSPVYLTMYILITALWQTVSIYRFIVFYRFLAVQGISVVYYFIVESFYMLL